MTRFGPIKTDHMLWIAAGAFHKAKPSDLLPEMQGRLPLRVELASLTESDYRAHPHAAGERAYASSIRRCSASRT